MLRGLGFAQVATLSGGTLTMAQSVPWLRSAIEIREPVVTYAEVGASCTLEVLESVPASRG